jgi:hypothetical protein
MKANLHYKSWKGCETNATDSREKNKQYLISHLFDNSLCDFISQNIQFQTRLGSDSVNAEVYLYHTFAIKVIPYDFIDSSKRQQVLKEIEQEIKISKQLSDYSIKHQYDHYPIFYDTIKCVQIEFHPQSSLGKKLISGQGYLLIFELLSFDLKHFLLELSEINIPEETLFEWISQVFDVIDHLNNRLRLCHNDLHIANLMFRCRKDKLVPDLVLIDFGKTIEIEKVEMKHKDLKTFFVSLRSFLTQNLSLQKKYPLFFKAVSRLSYDIKTHYTNQIPTSNYKEDFMNYYYFGDSDSDSD